MHKKVEAYLQKKQKEAAEQEQERRREILVEAGLYEKVYPTSEEYDPDEYPEFDSEKEKVYRMEPIDVTEEEFRAVEQYADTNQEEGVGGKIMGLAILMRWIGILGAIIGALAMMINDSDLILAALGTAVGGILTSIVTSWFLYAFGQLVADTHSIRKKLEEKK